MNSFDQTSLVLYVFIIQGNCRHCHSQILNVWSIIYLHLGVNVGKYTIHWASGTTSFKVSTVVPFLAAAAASAFAYFLLWSWKSILRTHPRHPLFWKVTLILPMKSLRLWPYHSSEHRMECLLEHKVPLAVWMTTCHEQAAHLCSQWLVSQVPKLLGETWNSLLVRIIPGIVSS